MYRGQNKFYEPNFPSLYRNNNSFEDKLINILKKLEFINLIKSYPIFKDLSEYLIYGCTMEHDFEGLCQHYGFLTSHLDLTNNKDIAMFFASTKYHNGKYENEDFNSIADEIEYLEITKELSEYYFNMFDGGLRLFPKDIIAKKAGYILNRNEIPINSIKKFLFFNQEYRKKDIENILIKKGFIITKKQITFSKKEISKVYKSWFKKDKKIFLSKVFFRGTSKPLYPVK